MGDFVRLADSLTGAPATAPPTSRNIPQTQHKVSTLVLFVVPPRRWALLPEAGLPAILTVKVEEVTVDEPLAQRILGIIYQDPDLRRLHKESLTDWILDTQPRTAPLDTSALVEYLAVHQPDLLNRLKINVRIKDDLARALGSIRQN